MQSEYLNQSGQQPSQCSVFTDLMVIRADSDNSDMTGIMRRLV